MPRLKKCPVCDKKVVPAIVSRGSHPKGICSNINGAMETTGSHYVYQYPMEIIYIKNGASTLSFWTSYASKKTHIYLFSAGSMDEIVERPLYTPAECMAFNERWLKAQVLS